MMRMMLGNILVCADIVKIMQNIEAIVSDTTFIIHLFRHVPFFIKSKGQINGNE